jgi:penicillin-binding protein 1A
MSTPPDPTAAINLPPERARTLRRVLFALGIVAAAMVGALAGLLLVYSTDLPQINDLERYRPSSITELFDQNGKVIGTFALERRVIAKYEDYPKVLRDAVISIEDKDFERHWGVDLWRILGAGYRDLASGSRAQGASTLTMQLSRNLFLTPERKFSRKVQEIMLAIQIERRFTKEQIFTLYANQIYLGHGVYGFEAGSEYYFGKPARLLTLEEAALLAGLPKAPTTYSPINNPEKALRRRNLVLHNMMDDGRITTEQAQTAKSLPINLRLQADPNDLAPYFVEEIRRDLEKRYGTDQVHEGGLRVYTGLDMELQKTATRAVLDGLAAYERRHGWKGQLRNVFDAGEDLESYQHPDWSRAPEVGSYYHGLVTEVTRDVAEIKIGKYRGLIRAADMAWTHLRSPAEILMIGELVYVRVTGLGPSKPTEGAHPAMPTTGAPETSSDERLQLALEQDSGAQGALLAIDNQTGEIRAMVGGRDFEESKFNRATQALRQTGSSFKPYVYAAAVEKGALPDDTIVDAPISFSSVSGTWSPHNYDNKYEGKITLRHALAESRNIPAVKLAERVGIRTVIDYVHKFGITADVPPYLPVALGSAEVTLLEQTAAYTAFPNDGVRLGPHSIRKVTDYEGHTMGEDFADVRDVISSHSARVMLELLQGVVTHGTGIAAGKLNHPLAGKTGTTNDFTDAWFIGFSPSITCGVWVGYDEKKTLGEKETGAQAALPIWIDFMKVAIANKKDEQFPAPLPRPAEAGKESPGRASASAPGHEAH